MATYIVIPWDDFRSNPDLLSCFPTLHTLAEVVDSITGAADILYAFDDGQCRQLSASEKTELERLLDLKRPALAS
jgi:hypothetical protein